MRIVEYDPFAGAAALSLAEADIIHPGMLFAYEPKQKWPRYSNPFGMLALASAAARAFIQPSRNALSSDGGLLLP